ncbi:MAG: fibronectin type III domain-containing protein [Nitrosotalea sp.]
MILSPANFGAIAVSPSETQTNSHDLPNDAGSKLAMGKAKGSPHPAVWCSLVHMNLGEISEGAFLAYLHFCIKPAKSSNSNTHTSYASQSPTITLASYASQSPTITLASYSSQSPTITQINNDPTTPNGTKRTQSEESIAVSGQNIVVGYNDNQDPNTSTYSGYSYSNDGGKTWTDGGGIIPNPGDFDANDPSVVTDSKGNFYFSMDIENATHTKIGVAKSTDGGKTFGNPVIIDSLNASTPVFFDKGYMGVGRNPANQSQDIIHITYTKFGKSSSETVYQRSLDGGLTWQDPCTLNPGEDAVGAMPIVDSSGNTVYVFYEDFVKSKVVGWKNTNAGAGCLWTPVTDVGVIHPLITHNVCGGVFAVWKGNQRETQIPVEAIGRDGSLYVTWNDSPDGGNTTEIVLYRSQDGGTTWTGPTTFSPTPGRDQFEPWIAVAPNGRVTMIFYDRVNDPNNLLMDLYAASSNDNGSTWQSNQRITPSSFSWGTLSPPSDPYFFPCYFIGEYQGITFDANNVAHIVWADGRVLASDGTPKPNVFYTQLITPTAPSAPQNLQASPGNAQVSLSWTAPSSNGGSAITGYMIERSTDGGTTWSTVQSNTGTTATTYSDTGLTASTAYTYRVSAINSVGTSSPSSTASAKTSSTQVSISVNSVDLCGKPITGMWTILRYTNGTTVTQGYTPASFNVMSGITYVDHVGNYGTTVFNHWNGGNTTSYYTITPTQNATLTAYYSTGSTCTAATAPQSPTGLAATAGNTQASLSWTAPANNGGSSVTNYKIYRSTSSGTETLLITVGNVNSYTDTGLTNGVTYYYKVTAVNSVGESAPSNEANAMPAAPATAPGSPTGLAATAVSSSQINLSWTAPANNGGSAITGYKIERSNDTGTTWSTIQSNTGTTATTYSDTGLTPSTAYTYRVSAINPVGTSPPSSTASAKTSSTQVSISVNSADLLGNPITGVWTILRYTNGTTVVQGFTPASFKVMSGTTYVAHVGNYQNDVFNHWSNGNTTSYYTITPTQNVTLTAYYSTSTVPHPPTGLTATAASSSQINLSWNAPSSNGGSAITGYMIERSTDGGTTWSTVQSNTGTTATTYSDTGLAQGATYAYRVSAINNVGTSTPSNTSSATTFTVPQPPAGLKATSASSSEIDLSWTVPSSNGGSTITGYEIERSTDSGTTWSTVVANTGSTSTAYSDSGLAHNTIYTYRVSAINAVGISTPSNTTSARTFDTVPTPPTNLIATGNLLRINLSWTTSNDNGGTPIIGYMIERSTNGGSTWSTIVSNTGSTGTTYSDTNVLPLTTYTYRVSAINDVGTGSPSNAASATTP